MFIAVKCYGNYIGLLLIMAISDHLSGITKDQSPMTGAERDESGLSLIMRGIFDLLLALTKDQSSMTF